MDRNDVLIEPSKEKEEGSGKKSIVYVRWLFILLMIPVSFLVPEITVSKSALFQTLAVAVVYNVLVTMATLKNLQKKRKNPALFVYLDILGVAIFSYQLGGINSDVFILFLFIIGYYGIGSDINHAARLSIFTVIVYTIGCISASRVNLEEMNYWRLLLRDAFIIFSAYAISHITGEVKRYDEMHRREFKLARTDKLTGLANRHYFDQKLKEEAEYADHSGNPLSVLIFDLDNFKRFNDTYGHVWGDKLLALFSDIIKQNIRRTDIPVRYGGEEFLILLRDLDMETAKNVGERIRKQLEKQRIYIGNDDNKKKVTVSGGVAEYPRHSKNIKEVIDYADKALYYAKEIGKNIVVGFDEIGKVQHAVQMDIDTYMNR